MRPIRLTMTAFGPYRDAETIDFAELQEQRLFVISGRTGAGKTSVFDAICYALYGTASGEDRADARMLRSHFADEAQHTSVELHFAVGTREYRVFRQLPHRKSGNKSETGGKAELYSRTGEEEEPALDRFTVGDVNAALERILGLTREQFSQIVMLPQGEFRKLLTSDTENKEDILRRIFRTSLLRKVEERFHERSKALREQLKEAHTKLDIYARQAADTLPQREHSRLGAVLGQEHRSAAQLLEGLHAEAAHYAARAGELKARHGAEQEQARELERLLRDATALVARFDELARTRAEQEALERQAPAIDQLRGELERSSRAAGLEPYEEQAQQAERLAASRRAARAEAAQAHER
ncbi:AAA family ATPase, partial [Paenibacillus sp. IB182496]